MLGGLDSAWAGWGVGLARRASGAAANQLPGCCCCRPLPALWAINKLPCTLARLLHNSVSIFDFYLVLAAGCWFSATSHLQFRLIFFHTLKFYSLLIDGDNI